MMLILFVKPRERHPAANLNVVTERANGERRSYQKLLGIMPERSRDPAFVLVRFAYSGDDAAKRREAGAAKAANEKSAQADRVLARDEKTGPRNFAYSVQGEADFEPIEVFDNGKVTTLRFTTSPFVTRIVTTTAAPTAPATSAKPRK